MKKLVTLPYVKDGKIVNTNFNDIKISEFLSKKEGKQMRVVYEDCSRTKYITDQQRKALHLWFGQVAEALNDAGYTVQIVLKHKVDVEWNKDLVKDILWRSAQYAILKKTSTTELKKQEDIDKVFDHLTLHFGEKFGIAVPFPDAHQIGADCGKSYCGICGRGG